MTQEGMNQNDLKDRRKGELLNYIAGFRSWFDMLTTNGL